MEIPSAGPLGGTKIDFEGNLCFPGLSGVFGCPHVRLFHLEQLLGELVHVFQRFSANILGVQHPNHGINYPILEDRRIQD